MNLIIKKMTQKYAIEALCWKYEKPYDFYNHVLTSSAILEMMTYRYFAVVDQENQLVGYFCIGKPAQMPLVDKQMVYGEDYVDLGIGMKPELTGKGKGYSFLSHILNFLENNFGHKDIRLTVATFNTRAIHLYKKFGFLEGETFVERNIEYVIMKKCFDGGE